MPGSIPVAAASTAGADAGLGAVDDAKLTPGEIATIWARYSGHSSQQVTTIATAIALAESGGNATVVNPSGSQATGLWQVEPSSAPQYTQDELKIPEDNAQAAGDLYGTRGWEPWTTYSSGAFEKFMPTAKKAVSSVNDSYFDDAAGAVSDVAGVASDAVDDTVDVGTFLGKMTAALFTQHGWIRILKFVIGIFVGALAIKELFANTPVGDAAGNIVNKAKDAAEVAAVA